MIGWFTLCPQYGNAACPQGPPSLGAFRAADPSLIGLFLTIGTAIPYVYPLSYLGLGILAMRRAAGLATIGIILGWLGSVAWGFIAEQMFVANELAHLGNDATAVQVLQQYATTSQTLAVATGWVIGHLLAYVFLGAALLRARVVPRWSAILMIASAPILGPIAYGTNNGWIQVGGFAMVLIASIPAALVMVRGVIVEARRL